MNGPESCTACGVAITPATSLISEKGVLCAACFGRWEGEQRATQSAAAAQEAVLLRQASRLGKLHGVNWAVALILLAGWVHVPGWLSSVLIAGVIVLSYAMRFRNSLAFRAALVLDTAGSLVLLVVSVSQLGDGRLAFLLFPVVFAWWLGWLTWRARGAFAVTRPF